MSRIFGEQLSIHIVGKGEREECATVCVIYFTKNQRMDTKGMNIR